MLNWVLEYLRGATFAEFGSIASIVSLVMTILVFINVRNIRRFYAFTARVPELNQQLSVLASKISNQLNDDVNLTIVKELLADVEVVVSSLSKRVENPLKKEAAILVKKIKCFDRAPSGYSKFFWGEPPGEKVDVQLRDVYISLYKFHAACRAAYEDARWEN